MASFSYFFFVFLLAFELITATLIPLPIQVPAYCGPILANDRDRIQFGLNLQFGAAEFFCTGALGVGLDQLAPSLTLGGPPPIGAMKANLDPLTNRIIEEFCYHHIGHIRTIFQTVGGVPRPLIDISTTIFAAIFDLAVGFKLNPPFDPYANTVNFLLASYLIPYTGLIDLVDTIPYLIDFKIKRLASGLLGVNAGEDAVIRTLLYQIADQNVKPYNLTTANFTVAISNLRNDLGKCGIKDEGLIVPKSLGAENKTTSNILSADSNSLSYGRTPPGNLRILYGSGNESQPGAFYPRGANGAIAKRFLEVI
ncbi:hypothetical protein ACFE04_017557 [Oxalis oulophora]